MISSIEDFIEKFAKDQKAKETLKQKLSDKNLKSVELKNEFINLTKDFSITLKRYYEKETKKNNETITTLIKNNIRNFITYQPIASITDPTPISWQFIIPADKVPNLIDKVMVFSLRVD